MWNYLQLMFGDSPRIEPMIGTGGMTRQEAHAKVQDLLNEMAAQAPVYFAAAVESWQRGAQDDTVHVQLPKGMVLWALYEYPEGQPPERAAMEWIDDFADIMRQGGAQNIVVAKFPDKTGPATPDAPPASATPDAEEDLALAAARRIAGHVREFRGRYPDGLAQLKHFAARRGQGGLPDWPQWCWVPMSAAHAIASQDGPLFNPADISRIAAVGQWKLQDRDIVTPTEDVASEAVPGPTPEPHEMDLAIPRERLLEALDGVCYYLVMPLPRPDDHEGEWLYGAYIHLEWDAITSRTELRLLLDFGHGWDALTPIYVHADLPTLAWSTRDIEASLPDTLPLQGVAVPGDVAATFARLAAWWAWPLVGALLDERALLVGPKTLDSPGLDAMARGARAWELTYDRPRPTAAE
ncbi:hypothetical protein AB0J43_45045 [Nonomuraea fuscirosea]